MRKVLAFTAAVSFALAGAARPAEPANTLKDMFGQLGRCLSSVHIGPETDVTIQFALNRRGGVIGKPRLTHVHWPADETAKTEAADAIAQGFDHCLPLSISDSLGGAIAGRRIVFRLKGSSGKAQNA